MKLLFKKVLINILMLMVVMLPFRSVFAVPMTMSAGHCAEPMADVAMVMMDHANHAMSSADFQDGQQDRALASCTCCDQCDGDCTGCAQISSAITFDFLQISKVTSIELVSIVADSLLTRTLSPPSRPPLKL